MTDDKKTPPNNLPPSRIMSDEALRRMTIRKPEDGPHPEMLLSQAFSEGQRERSGIAPENKPARPSAKGISPQDVHAKGDGGISR